MMCIHSEVDSEFQSSPFYPSPYSLLPAWRWLKPYYTAGRRPCYYRSRYIRFSRSLSTQTASLVEQAAFRITPPGWDSPKQIIVFYPAQGDNIHLKTNWKNPIIDKQIFPMAYFPLLMKGAS
jgi:hypothetical protein